MERSIGRHIFLIQSQEKRQNADRKHPQAIGLTSSIANDEQKKTKESIADYMLISQKKRGVKENQLKETYDTKCGSAFYKQINDE